MARFEFLIISINLLMGGGYGLLSREQLTLKMFMVTDIIMIMMISLISLYYVHFLINTIIG